MGESHSTSTPNADSSSRCARTLSGPSGPNARGITPYTTESRSRDGVPAGAAEATLASTTSAIRAVRSVRTAIGFAIDRAAATALHVGRVAHLAAVTQAARLVHVGEPQ